MFKKILLWMKSNIIFMIVLAIAGVSCFFVLPDKGYLEYFKGSGQTLTAIFGILLIVAGLENIDFFHKVARVVVKKFKSVRSIVLALIFITYFSSLVNANDMALLTFLPLSYLVLKYINKLEYLGFTFVMQNIASNLGGMFSPIGNPQNIYLFSYYDIGLLEFFKIMLIPTLVALVLIIATCLFIKKDKVEYSDNYDHKINLPKLIVYIVLFVCTFLVVCNVLPFWIVLPVLIITMLCCDYKSFTKIDYTIPLTFVAFFIFSGNMGRIPAIENLITNLANKDTFLCAYVSCQFISNVPTSILLSNFTTNYPALLVSVNVASLGIIFSSLSGLIALKCFTKYHNFEKKIEENELSSENIETKETINEKDNVQNKELEKVETKSKEKPKRKSRKSRGVWYYVGLDLLMNVALLVILYPASYFSLMLW